MHDEGLQILFFFIVFFVAPVAFYLLEAGEERVEQESEEQ